MIVANNDTLPLCGENFMNTLHPIMSSALNGFRPSTRTPDVPAEQRVIDLQRRLKRLLRTPFMLEVETRAAIKIARNLNMSKSKYRQNAWSTPWNS
jgi:hypothetical protein